MRHWEQGLPLPPGASLGGRPCAIWLDRFLLCHGPGEGGWVRGAWPDGQPLLAQSWPEAAAFRIVADELARVRSERARPRRRTT